MKRTTWKNSWCRICLTKTWRKSVKHCMFFPLKPETRNHWVKPTQIYLSKALKQSKKAENDVSSILLKFSPWVPLKKWTFFCSQANCRNWSGIDALHRLPRSVNFMIWLKWRRPKLLRTGDNLFSYLRQGKPTELWERRNNDLCKHLKRLKTTKIFTQSTWEFWTY